MATITTTGHGTHQSMSGTFHSTESCYNPVTDATHTSPQSTNLSATESNYEAPLPNPPFVFPARPAMSGPAVSRNRRQPSQSNNEAREGLNMDFKLGREVPAARRAPPPLPSFSFNQTPRTEEEPGTGGAPLSPGLSARLSMPIPSRPAQHSRGASEFVFGAPKSGPGSLLSVSPQEGGALPPPGRSGPPGGRRGHAHRRSAAISCGDLSFLVKPKEEVPPLPTTGSTPTTAADVTQVDESATSSKNTVTEGGQNRDATPPRKAGRVGFSDTLEFIPRPLSLVSSDASSTMTIRQGHSVSNSLSSVVSVSSPSPPPTEHRGLPTSSPRSTNRNEDRPSTAGPVLGYAKSLESLRGSDDEAAMRRNSDPPTLEEANNGKTARGSKKYDFTDDFHGNDSAGNSIPSGSTSVNKARPPLERINSASFGPGPAINYNAIDYTDMPRLARKTSSVRGSIKKKKKVKSWAGSILSGKAKPRSKKGKSSKRSATPPMVNYEYAPAMPPQPQLSQVIEKYDTPEIDLDEAYASTSSLPPLSNTQTSFSCWKPRHISTFDDDDSSSPIIDLDAALRPFNTPTHDSDWQAAPRTQTTTRKKMHSASKMNNFVGQGMHYHRRAESAPALVPFDNPRFGLGSSCTMEDVFEEDEEDEEWEEIKSVSHKSSTIKADDEESVGFGIEIKVVDAENSNGKGMDWSNDDGSVRGIKRKTSALSELDINRIGASANTARSSSPLRESFSMDDFAPPPPITDEACIIQRPQSSSRSSTSSATPPVREVYGKEFPFISNQPYTGQPPFLTPTTPSSTFNQSPIPSPRSRFSQDTQRQSTAPSSILEEPGFNPLWLGEPGPEIRMSVDDVPSLTSSNSTMTGSMANTMNPAFGNPQFRNGQRSVSMSGPAATRKRVSIASLSRLLSSHGSEKSKLSIEQQADGSDDGSVKKEASKGRRMSRIMQFWKRDRDVTP